MNQLPLDNISIILSFLDGESLLSSSCVNYDFFVLIDNKEYWKNVSYKKYPYLKDNIPYQGSWKHLFKDKNKIGRNRAFVFEWKIPNFLEQNKRLYSNEFEVGDYKFNLICDPTGNPNVFFMEQSMSVYLKCLPKVSKSDNWESCCDFSISCINNIPSKRNITWNSTMENKKFYKQRESWGIHGLLALSTLKDKSNGYLSETNYLKLRVKLNLSYMKINVYHLQKEYNGFGITDLTNIPFSYELFECTTVEKLKIKIINDLNLINVNQTKLWIYVNQIRLWIFTHPSQDTSVLSPKILITESNMNSTINEIMSSYKNSFNTVKLFVECSRDNAFYESSENKIPRFIQSNSLSVLPQINNSNNIIIFLKIYDSYYTTYIIINPLSPLHILFSLISSITGYKVNDLKTMIEVCPVDWNSIGCKEISYPNNDNCIESFNIKNGDILTFYEHKNKNKIQYFYNSCFDSLKNDLYKLHGSRLQIYTYNLEKLIQLCEKLGFLHFRIYNLNRKLNKKNIKDTLSYILNSGNI